jgi:hypothetical protein
MGFIFWVYGCVGLIVLGGGLAGTALYTTYLTLPLLWSVFPLRYNTPGWLEACTRLWRSVGKSSRQKKEGGWHGGSAIIRFMLDVFNDDLHCIQYEGIWIVPLLMYICLDVEIVPESGDDWCVTLSCKLVAVVSRHGSARVAESAPSNTGPRWKVTLEFVRFLSAGTQSLASGNRFSSWGGWIL